MKRIAILETSPSGPIELHRFLRLSPLADFFFVTHDEPVEGGMFNPASTWIDNRNRLWARVLAAEREREERYEWYFFTDYDVAFNPSDCLEILLDTLDFWNPAIAFPWYLRQGDPPEDKTPCSGVFGNNMAVVFHRTAADLLFPMPFQFGGFWDGASYVNVMAAVAWPYSVIQIPLITSKSMISGDYAANVNAEKGKADMQKAYEWQKRFILRRNLPRSVHDFKRQMLCEKIEPIPQIGKTDYSDRQFLSHVFDFNHPYWKLKRSVHGKA